ISAHTKEDDWVEHLFIASTHDYVMFFTQQGQCYWLKVHEIPQAARAARGKPILSCVAMKPDERSQFPPVSAARSTITDPGFRPCTAAAVMRIGAFLPGIAAVEITMSASFAAPARNASSLRCVSSDSSLAYPPAVSACSSMVISRNVAPRL